jgi:RNA polymerase sigma factor (sigma-70 family)
MLSPFDSLAFPARSCQAAAGERGSPLSSCNGPRDDRRRVSFFPVAHVTSDANAASLFALYHDRLLRYFNRAAGEREVARDLTQEVFLRVSRTAIPAVPGTQLAGWLFKIARNVALDHHRQRRRRPESDLASAPERATNPQQQMVLALKQALATLSELDRDVFLLREVGGLSRREIAIACDLTSDAVRSRIHRARQELRSLLAAPIAALREGPIGPVRNWKPGP